MATLTQAMTGALRRACTHPVTYVLAFIVIYLALAVLWSQLAAHVFFTTVYAVLITRGVRTVRMRESQRCRTCTSRWQACGDGTLLLAGMGLVLAGQWGRYLADDNLAVYWASGAASLAGLALAFCGYVLSRSNDHDPCRGSARTP